MSSNIALVGSPNSGKTTLFNALTGSRQKTGNYAGVTVEKKVGHLELPSGRSLELVDLPGAYSLDARTPDEAVTAEVVCGGRVDGPKPDLIIAVADSTNLERSLYLVLQLKELGLPTVLALSMGDLAKKRGIQIDAAELERRLGFKVVLTSATRGEGLVKLMELVEESLKAATPPFQDRDKILKVDNRSEMILSRYKWIDQTIKAVLRRNQAGKDATRAIDRVVLNRFFGPLILLVSFALMFQLIFSVAQIPMNAIQSVFAHLQNGLRAALPAGDLESLLVDGVLAGVGSVVVFLPQILLLFAFILLFEDSGYMARAAFILDRLMSRVGLSGRAFIPLLSSFACAVPGIMATRTIEHRRDRLITILVAPLMTCSARIPVYTLLIAAFIPATRVWGIFTWQGLVMMGLYLFGVVSVLTVAVVLKRTLLRGDSSTFIMELPTYKVPSIRNLLMSLWDRARIFLKRAGTVIFAISILLWFFARFPHTQVPASAASTPQSVAAYQLEHSFAGRAGKLMEPVIRPLGYDWKIGVALLTSFAAREVVLSTLGTVYSIGYDRENTEGLQKRIQQEPGFGIPTALSMLVFYALACQCVSTLAVTRRETNSLRWPAFMFSYMTTLAYLSAFATFNLVSLWFKP